MQVSANNPARSFGATVLRCLQLGRHYLFVPDRLHRGFSIGVVLIIVGLVFCFVSFAYAEKYQLADNFFYGRLKFSFIDGGYPEIFGYILELTASVLFLLFAVAHHKKCWLAWSMILFIVFLDDAFQLHETIGHMYVDALGVIPVVGDLFGFATTGLVSAVFWLTGLRGISDKDDFPSYLLFSVYFALLIFFGVGVDAMHGLFGENASQTLLTLLEDGGELCMTAVIVISVLGMWMRQKLPVTAAAIQINPVVPKH